ncbi:MAG: DUF1326 domain-containing protein [Candidatus Binataceae bacterium]|nr:DUF1326 domain-containing protein [Candidatus Binataceae bacterium]
MAETWSLKGQLIGTCSCDWGCPCSFNAPPTKGFCDGVYVWHVSRGRFGKTRLDDLSFAMCAHSPGPIHEGNVIWQPLIESRSDAAQREAIKKLIGGNEGGPWQIFAAVTTKQFDPLFARIAVKLNGIKSRVKIGDLVNMAIEPIRNPVTGSKEELRLVKPTGFTSKWADLGRSKIMKVTTPELTFDYSGQYAEFSEFSYSS